MSIEQQLNSSYLDIAPEVAKALEQGKAVVALESTIISHGMPYPRNVETALTVEETVRKNGATPATIAILNGRVKVGLSGEELEYLGKSGSKKKDGATTVASTMIVAALAGISVFATGGIGGVHRGFESTMDVSADLEELAQTSVAVVCAGVKSILDIGRTLEFLETKGVPVVGYKTDKLPAFYARESDFGVDYRIDDPVSLAEAMHTKWQLGMAASSTGESRADSASAVGGVACGCHERSGLLGRLDHRDQQTLHADV
eukprot:snap_masked-scaffold1_size3401120-processed-gene-30.12 protein:Tk04943 transcript:snap_masked-scaffold1_size3401120-processed-gene-30.12-mRNA-1 annotation:"pseudouridine-5 -phosphate glycosidase"